MAVQAAFELHKQGRLAEAGRIYQAIIQREPRNAQAIHYLGLLLYQTGQYEAAAKEIGRAIAIDPRVAAMHCNRGAALAALQRFEAAVVSYDAALRLEPGFAEAQCNRGNALKALDRLDEAVASYDRALKVKPDSAAAHAGRGAALRMLKRPAEALASFDVVLALSPGQAETLGERGAVLEDLGRLDEALASYEQAIALEPQGAIAHFNRGNVLKKLRRIDEAIASYEQAIAQQPDFAIAHHNLAVCLLLAGRVEAGFREYEWRKQAPDFAEGRSCPGPSLGPGEDIAGKTLFIYPELFLGDVIQFARYARLAEARGAEVVLAAPAPLHALLGTLSPSLRIVASDAEPPPFDRHCALMSLPFVFGAGVGDVYAPVPYLSAEPARVEAWRSRLGGHGVRIGICWQGSTAAYATPMQRSFPLRALGGVGRIPGVRLISLQKHDGLDQLAQLVDEMAVETLGPSFDEGPDAFLDTAAVMACCDLVITADTAVAHLAGALGVRTWIALPYVPDWRWGLDGGQSPWHPTARLFRQPSPGDWPAVFAQIEAALAAEIDAGGFGRSERGREDA